MRTGSRTAIAGLATALIMATGGTASAVPPPGPTTPGPTAAPRAAAPPPGWTVTRLPSGQRLTWTADEPVPVGDASIEFLAGDRVLGVPQHLPDGRSLQLDVLDQPVGDLAGLQVHAGGRRLDGPRPAAPAPGAPGRPDRAPRPAAPLPAADVDPGTPGPFETVSGEYELPDLRLPELPQPVERAALVVAPQGTSGPLPLVLFLHGRHAVCYHPVRGVGRQVWPCPATFHPIPSQLGYRRAQELLASQGYLTVSIAANGINGQDAARPDFGAAARSALIRDHLAHWARWAGAERESAPEIVRTVPAADLSRVLLVGHSRGGEGANRAAIDSASPPPAGSGDGFQGTVQWRILGTMLIAPTAFGQNPAPDVPSVVLLPGCDGDVDDLQGQAHVDATRAVSGGGALHSAVFVVGANHNYFNSEWTPGLSTAPANDDWSARTDPVCGSGAGSLRLTGPQQQSVGATYVAAAARLFVRGDDRVRPLLDGSGVRAPSADPARVHSHAVGAARTALLSPGPQLAVAGSAATRARVCDQVHRDPAAACVAGTDQEPPPLSPHFARFGRMATEPGRYAVALNWSAADGPAEFRPVAPVALTGAQAVALRLVVPPNTTGTRFDVAVVDGGGRRAELGQVAVDGLPGSGRTTDLWAQEVRVPLAAATGAGLDLGRITAVELIPRTASGRAWLIDAWSWSPGMPAVTAAPLPRLDLGQVEVPEGDTGVRTPRLPVTVSGSGEGQVRVFVTDLMTGGQTDRLVTVGPGTGYIDLPVTVHGNTRHGADIRHRVLVKATQRTVVGNFVGALTVLDDDPAPEVSVEPVAARVAEGAALTWRLTLSAPADVRLTYRLTAVAPPAGTQVSTTDLDAGWLRGQFDAEPLPSRPLSATEGSLLVDFPVGGTVAEAVVPTAADQVAEGDEHVALQLKLADGAAGQSPLPQLTGTVTDAP